MNSCQIYSVNWSAAGVVETDMTDKTKMPHMDDGKLWAYLA